MKLTAMRIGWSKAEKKNVMNFVENALDSGYVADGQYTDAMTDHFKKETGGEVALASSVTGAIELLCKVLKKKHVLGGRKVMMMANCWLSIPNAVERAGLGVRWCDMDEETLLPSIQNLEDAYDTDIRILIVTHLGGRVDKSVFDIAQWCSKKNVILIEDCGQCVGSRTSWNDTVGKIGDFSVFTTGPLKFITAGYGGVVCGNKEVIYEIDCMLRYGKSEPFGPFEINTKPHQFRFNEINAAIFCGFLNSFPYDKVRDLCAIYEDEFNKYENPPKRYYDEYFSGFKYLVYPENHCREAIREELKGTDLCLGTGVWEWFLPEKLSHQVNALPLNDSFTEEFCSKNFCLPTYPEITEEQARQIVTVVMNATGGKRK